MILTLLVFQGKFIRINFDVNGYIVGANIETCILVFSLVVSSDEGLWGIFCVSLTFDPQTCWKSPVRSVRPKKREPSTCSTTCWRVQEINCAVSLSLSPIGRWVYKWHVFHSFPLSFSRAVSGELQQLPFSVQRERDHPGTAGQRPVHGDDGVHEDHGVLWGRDDRWISGRVLCCSGSGCVFVFVFVMRVCRPQVSWGLCLLFFSWETWVLRKSVTRTRRLCLMIQVNASQLKLCLNSPIL